MTSRLGIQLDCLCGCYETMQKEAERKQLEEEESPYLAKQEHDPDWM